MVYSIGFDQFLRVIENAAEAKSPLIVALSGFGGSGKTTLARKVADLIEDISVIALDDFIFTPSLNERSSHWKGFDGDRLIEEVLKPLKSDEPEINYGLAEWPSGRVTSERIVVTPKIVIVEGVGLIQSKFRDWFDLSFWIDAPLEESSARGRLRDREAGLNHEKLWDEVWIPNDRDYFAKHHPDTRADFLIKLT